jgi:hypothetical protein
MVVAKKSSGTEKFNNDMFGDVPVLQRKWQAALRPGDALPRYEDVMLGSLGGSPITSSCSGTTTARSRSRIPGAMSSNG